MEDRIVALIDQLLDENGRDEQLSSLDDDALAGVDADLIATMRAVRAGEVDGTAPDDVETLSRIRDARNVVAGERTRREETAATAVAEAAEREVVAAALAAEVIGTPTEPETPVEPEDPADPETPPADPEAAVKPTPSRMPSLAALAAARPTGDPGVPVPSRVTSVTPRWELKNGTKADFDDLSGIAERMLEARNQLIEAPPGFTDRVTVATLKVPRPAEIEVRAGDDLADMQRKVEAAVAPAQDPSAWTAEQKALVASGGWCAPLQPRYELPSIVTAARPYRDGLARVPVSRGGLTYVRAARLGTIVTSTGTTAGSAVSVWTAATDETPGGATKPRQTFTCRTVVEEDLDAIVARGRFGNLHSRGFPEDVRHDIELMAAAHARVAETRLIDSLITDIAVDTTQTGFLGTARDARHHLHQAAAQIRYVERMARGSAISGLVNAVLLDMVSEDITMQQASGELDALFQGEPEARRILTQSTVNLVYGLDVPTGSDAFISNSDVAGGTESLADWPDNFWIPIFPAGSAAFLDGGELNLGIVRDSTLNNTNDYEMFMETFEGLAWLGPFGVNLRLTTCPAGDSQVALDNTAALCTGS